MPFALLLLAAASPAAASPVAKPAYVAPCPGISPAIRRVRGSNCHGILPQRCGADRMAAFRGKFATVKTRLAVERAVGHRQIRWIAPGEAVTDDLRYDRLNVHLDRRKRIQGADCY